MKPLYNTRLNQGKHWSISIHIHVLTQAAEKFFKSLHIFLHSELNRITQSVNFTNESQ